MKAISILQPWASLVAVGAKKIETRSWATKYRGPLAVHASARMSRKQKKVCWTNPFFKILETAGLMEREVDGKHLNLLPVGAIIATCSLVDCVKIVGRTSVEGRIVAAQLENRQVVEGDELVFGDYTPGRFAWILEDVQPLPEPIPTKGMLGLWEWQPLEGVKLT